MTKDHYIKIIDNYKYILAQALPNAEPVNVAFIAHMREMCPKTIEYIKAGKTEKAMRWLGFLQGMMCRMGLRALGELKEDNKANGQHRTSREGRESVSPNRR